MARERAAVDGLGLRLGECVEDRGEPVHLAADDQVGVGLHLVSQGLRTEQSILLKQHYSCEPPCLFLGSHQPLGGSFTRRPRGRINWFIVEF